MPTRAALQRELLSAEKENVLLEELLVAKRLQIEKIKKLNARSKLCVQHLEQELERQIKETAEVINKHERENIDAQAALEESIKAKEEPKAKIKKLAKDTNAVMADNTKLNELLRETNEKMFTFVKHLTPEDYELEEPQVAESEDCSANNILQRVFCSAQEVLDAIEGLSQEIQCLGKDVFTIEKVLPELEQLLDIELKESQEEMELITSEYDALRDRIEQIKDNIKQKQQDIAEILPELDRTLPQDILSKLSTVYNCCKNRPEGKQTTLEILTFIEKVVDEQLQQIEAIRGSKYHRIKNKVIRERTEREKQKLIAMEEQRRLERLKKRQRQAFKSVGKATKRSSLRREKDTAN